MIAPVPRVGGRAGWPDRRVRSASGTVRTLVATAVIGSEGAPVGADVTRDRWETAVLETTKGKPLERLARRSLDDVVTPVLRTPEDGVAPIVIAGPAEGVVLVDGTAAACAGASDAQILAFCVATAVEHARGAGTLETPRFRLPLGQDQFTSIAAVRALRVLWARVAELAGADEHGCEIVAVTSPFMFTRRDPWVNLLRATTATFAGIVGGADDVEVLPFDHRLGAPGALGRRMAANTKRILLEESQLRRVADPGAGSWHVEALTRDLAEAAWEELQRIEASGGMAAAFADGSFAARLAGTREARNALLRTRRMPLTGVSEFPLVGERLPEVDGPADAPNSDDPAFPVVFADDLFDGLRTAAESADDAPTVFLANLGSLATYNARATFATNFHGVGGIDAIDSGGFEDDAALAEAFRESGAPIAVICSSDAVYADRAAAAARALKEAGAVRVTLAGRPGELEQDLRDAGVDGFIAIGSDVVAELEAALTACGVAITTEEGAA